MIKLCIVFHYFDTKFVHFQCKTVKLCFMIICYSEMDIFYIGQFQQSRISMKKMERGQAIETFLSPKHQRDVMNIIVATDFHNISLNPANLPKCDSSPRFLA